jgi:hypothetical protein
MIVTKRGNAIFGGKLCLGYSCFFEPEIIEAQVSRYLRLIVSFETRSCRGNADPFGKPFTPPQVIFRNGVVLGQIEADNFHVCTEILFRNLFFSATNYVLIA